MLYEISLEQKMVVNSRESSDKQESLLHATNADFLNDRTVIWFL